MIGSLPLTALTAVGGSAATGDSATTLPPLVIPAPEAALASDVEGFTCLYQAPKVKTLEYDDGYVYATLSVYRAPFTEKSNLYLLNAAVQFTPGHVAILNDNTQSNGEPFADSYLGAGFFHIRLAEVNEGWRHSSKLKIKQCWPQSSDVSTTISSSFGSELSLGFSKGGKISMNNGGSLGFEGDVSSSLGLSFSFSKSKSSLVDDPSLSEQWTNEDSKEVERSFETLYPKVAGSLTYSLDANILFEMDESANGMSDDAFYCQFTTMKQGVDADGNDLERKVTKPSNSIAFFYS